MVSGYPVAEDGTVSATEHDSVFVTFDVTSDQRVEIATVISDKIDLDAVPHHTELADAYLLENGGIAVDVHQDMIEEYGWG